jgi:hypothetical protein
MKGPRYKAKARRIRGTPVNVAASGQAACGAMFDPNASASISAGRVEQVRAGS